MFGLLLSMCVCFSCREHGKVGRVVVPDSMMTLQEIDSALSLRVVLPKINEKEILDSLRRIAIQTPIDSDSVLAYNFFPIFGEKCYDAGFEYTDFIESVIADVIHYPFTLRELEDTIEHIGDFTYIKRHDGQTYVTEYLVREAPRRLDTIVNHTLIVFTPDPPFGSER